MMGKRKFRKTANEFLKTKSSARARARTHTHAHTRTHAHTHARTHTHTHACMHACIYMYAYSVQNPSSNSSWCVLMLIFEIIEQKCIGNFNTLFTKKIVQSFSFFIICKKIHILQRLSFVKKFIVLHRIQTIITITTIKLQLLET